ncbi:MAG: hypothetical protein ACLTDR_04805 [Adlercreutzia equolifaciens]
MVTLTISAITPFRPKLQELWDAIASGMYQPLETSAVRASGWSTRLSSRRLSPKA